MARLFRLIHALQGECSAEGFLDVGGLPLTDPPAKTVVESIDKCIQGNLLDERLAIDVGVGIRSGSEKENVVSKGAQRLTPLTTTGAELCPMQADAFRGEKSRSESGTQGSVVVEGGFWQAQDKTLSWTTKTNQQNLPPRLIVPSVDGGGNVKVLKPGLEVVTGFAVEQLGHDERTVEGSVAIHCCEKKKLTDKAKKKRRAERTGRAQRSRTSHVWRQCKNVKYVCQAGSQLPSTRTQHDLRV